MAPESAEEKAGDEQKHAVAAVLALQQTARLDEALALCDQALIDFPNIAELHCIRGDLLAGQGQMPEAIDSFSKAIALKPNFAVALNNRGNAYQATGQFEAALGDLRAAAALSPAQSAIFFNLANVLLALERPDDALEQLDTAVGLSPGFVQALFSRGNILYELGRYEDALASYDQVIALNPKFAAAFNNRGNALSNLDRIKEAFESYDVAFKLDPALPYVEGSRFREKSRLCDWDDINAERIHLTKTVQAGLPAAWPFSFLAIRDSPPIQQACAETCVRDRYPASSDPMWIGQRYKHDRIRVAYLSADFHERPMPILMAGVFEHHDKASFETVGISYGPDSKGEMRGRLVQAFDRFIDVRGSSDRKVAELLRELEIDIAVDLMGFTRSARTGIFADRPAPIQVGFLGYPGTMGASYIDYIFADHVVIPNESRSFYSEKIAYLPDCYCPNDSQRRITPTTPSRREHGLPAEGFVFCSFNTAHKYTPEFFDIWMRLLHQVDGSVLWLMKNNTLAPENLRREATRRGIAPERLIFAPLMNPADHLARHRHADLFLDTLPYNAHTTACDALWAGLPVVTCLGSAFAARVAGSFLHTLGLHELITHSVDAYEALALRLAKEPGFLAGVEKKLGDGRETSPLFDTARSTRSIEAAYKIMRGRAERGESPETFDVPAPSS